MQIVTLTFNSGLPNNSLAVGDLAYFIKNPNLNAKIVRRGNQVENLASGDQSGVSTHVYIGEVLAIKPFAVANPGEISQTETPYGFKIHIKATNSYIGQVSVGNGLSVDGGDYIFFMKNNLVEQSSVLGYYNSVTIENNSKSRAELFAVSCEVTESSK